MKSKSSVADIRARFDADVERFSHLETGQSATMDAPIALELVARAAAAVTPGARRLLDIGCGAGNFSLRTLDRLPGLSVTLIDLSRPMLERALERIQRVAKAPVTAMQSDIRDAELGEEQFDIILAAAVLHHLRTEEEWRSVMAKCHRALTPGGSLWIFDLVDSSIPGIRDLMTERYGEYLAALKGPEYRDTVFAYIEQEDSPAPLTFQLNVLQQTGFKAVELLHKNGPFAAFGAVK